MSNEQEFIMSIVLIAAFTIITVAWFVSDAIKERGGKP